MISQEATSERPFLLQQERRTLLTVSFIVESFLSQVAAVRLKHG